MNDRTRLLAAVGVTVLLFLGVQLGALALIEPFHDADRQAVEDPDDPTNSAIYLVAILLATALMLGAFRYDMQGLIRALIVGVSVLLAWFVLVELLPPVLEVGPVDVGPILAALGVGAALVVYPEWYVIDAAGVLMGAGAAALFGISFGLLPAILLLAALAVYDAISVYRTEHMLDLAEGVMELKIPVVLVIPTSLSYSYRSAGAKAETLADDESAGDETDEGSADGTDDPSGDVGPSTEDVSSSDAGTGSSDADAESGDVDAESGDVDAESGDEDAESGDEDAESGDVDADSSAGGDDPGDAAASQEPAPERDALFIGLGDAVIPTVLVASAAYFLEAGQLDVPGLALNVPALGALVGTLAGLLVLMYMVLQGRAHAGLPLLNGGAIGGYLLGAVASGLSILTALGL